MKVNKPYSLKILKAHAPEIETFYDDLSEALQYKTKYY